MTNINLTQFIRMDLTVEQYYAAGDNFLPKAFDLLSGFGNKFSTALRMTQGGLDTYLPIQLKLMNHNAAGAMEKLFGDYVWSQLGSYQLVPYYNPAFLDPDNKITAANKQRVDFPLHAAELLTWFENDPIYRDKTMRLCDATMTSYDRHLQGVFPWADVTTGKFYGRMTLIEYIGYMALGMATVTKLTGQDEYLRWADQKVDFVCAERPNSNWLLVDRFMPDGYLNLEPSGTDTLYFVRRLFEMWKLFDHNSAYQNYATKYRANALAVAQEWYAKAWMPQFGHFAGHLKFDGCPYQERIYGDSKWNILYTLVWAYRVTRQDQYLSRIKEAWQKLLAMSTDTPGLVDASFTQGVGSGLIDESSPNPRMAQINFLDLLLEAHEASNDPYFLAQAIALGERMMAKGDIVFSDSSALCGSVFLRLALANSKIRRLQITMGATERRITIKSEGNGERTLDAIVPVDFAIVYLPQERYVVTVNNRSKNLVLDSDMTVAFP